jgi:hypothetical protein
LCIAIAVENSPSPSHNAPQPQQILDATQSIKSCSTVQSLLPAASNATHGLDSKFPIKTYGLLCILKLKNFNSLILRPGHANQVN